MIGNLLLSCALLLVSAGTLTGHPVSDSAEMPYAGPVLMEEDGMTTPEEMSLSDSRGSALDLSPLFNTNGLTAAGLVPREALRQVLLAKQRHYRPYSGWRGYRKRSSDCFWKYCV
ncbi:urotensin 2, alpha [Alosa alosa]|uniref:urotensin 2, alpha n=1 Tax=Alosa sapidissima TaxID=34773 RepID=UPI001C0A2CD5|nr:urotensin 2, alpha [Alosa sapidissima]XP_048097620.1 urotensin 2, alpha [Alosa alosa]